MCTKGEGVDVWGFVETVDIRNLKYEILRDKLTLFSVACISSVAPFQPDLIFFRKGWGGVGQSPKQMDILWIFLSALERC